MSGKLDEYVKENQPPHTFDDILCAIGGFGRWQKILFVLVPLVGILDGLNALAQVFTGRETDHWCRVAAWDAANCTGSERPDDWECLTTKRGASIPYNTTTRLFDSCIMYDVRRVDFIPGLNATDITNGTIGCSDGWVYDTRQYKTTIITEFDLVCNNKGAVSFLQSVYFAGFLVGSIVFGSLADYLGRKPTIYISSALLLVASIGNVFSPNVLVYMVFRFFTAVGVMGAFLVAFVLVTEFIGPSQRALVGVSLQVFFAIGITILPLLAYLIRTWRFLQLIIALPTSLYFLLYFYTPESARWQISKGRHDQAEITLRRVARSNKREFPQEMFSLHAQGYGKEQTSRQETVIALFRTPNMCAKTVNLMLNWFVNNMVYFGLGMSTSDLGANDYVASAIAGLVEFPSLIYCVVALKYSGRIINLSGTMIVGGVACLITAFLELGVARTVIAMVGKFFISASFAIIYVVSGELFPTPVRSAGLGLSSMSARISGILSPFVLDLKSVWSPLPFVLFGGLSIASGILTLLLPETRNKTLPETLEEGEAFGKPKWCGENVDDSTDVTMETSQTLNTETTHGNKNYTEKVVGFWREFEGLADIYEDIWGAKTWRLYPYYVS